MKTFQILTCEHRKYSVKAKSFHEAVEYIQEEADLSPKDKKVKLVNMGDFEITNPVEDFNV